MVLGKRSNNSAATYVKETVAEDNEACPLFLPAIADGRLHLALPPGARLLGPRLAGPLQEPGGPGRRPRTGGVALHRGQSTTGRTGDGPGAISVVELPRTRAGRRQPTLESAATVGRTGTLGGGTAGVLAAVGPSAADGARVGGGTALGNEWSALRLGPLDGSHGRGDWPTLGRTTPRPTKEEVGK